jgi:hypothetical protein
MTCMCDHFGRIFHSEWFGMNEQAGDGGKAAGVKVPARRRLVRLNDAAATELVGSVIPNFVGSVCPGMFSSPPAGPPK